MNNLPLTEYSPRHTLMLLADCMECDGGDCFGEGSEGLFLLRLSALLASGWGGRVLLLKVLAVPEGESISTYSTRAQALRKSLENEALEALAGTKDHASGLVTPVVRVALHGGVAQEVRGFLESEPGALLLLPMDCQKRTPGNWLGRALKKPLPCDLAWVQLPKESYAGDSHTAPFETGIRILLPVRGGPQAELAIGVSQAMTEALRAQVAVLHLVQGDMPERERASEEAPFNELLEGLRISKSGGEPPAPVRHIYATSQNPTASIGRVAEEYDLVVMGAGGDDSADLGGFSKMVARASTPALLALKTRVPVGPAIRAARKRARPHALRPEELSLIVDKWFAENTFHANEFSDLQRLLEIKQQRGVTISVGLPALNEEETIGGVISVLKESLMERVPLVDEIVVIDSNSTDKTREIAAAMGVPVYIHQEILPEAGTPLDGKGEALWKSLHVLKGDIIAWVDTDVTNMHPQFVYGLIGPLLREPRLGYVKGYYHRPIRAEGRMEEEGGGRVTELTVRPLLNLFFPLLSGVVQPLAGEYAGRREVLEQLPFFSGYGVETGLLVDLLERYGLYSIGQVNLEKRVHRNRPLADLSLTAFAIVQVILTRLQDRARITLLEEVNRSMKMIHFERDHLSLEVKQVQDVERPPMVNFR
ncbi:MAG TPA: glucosyl-3-phosphoglycerate synthase [Chloroflexia bacterium]|nr:glucosyl-3-phosphoglycerate synthase [Chloroflexia bacterium]